MADSDISDELIERVRHAHATRTPLQIRGGNSKYFLGQRVMGDPLEVGAHAGIVDYEPKELVLTARAGTPLRAIEATLGEHGQSLGFEPPHFGSGATLGGTLACNVSGPARPWRGSVRDAVLGIRLINGRGRHMRFGGRVIKNVAGFDVARLQAGAFGSFGVITEISLKVVPAAQTTATVAMPLSAAAAVKRMNELAGKAQPMSAAAWTGGYMYIRYSGTAEAVAAATHSLGGEQTDDSIWEKLRERRLAAFEAHADLPLWRLSVGATSAALTETNDVVIDWCGAQRFTRRAASLEEMADIAASAGGYAMRVSQGNHDNSFMQQPSAGIRKLNERLKNAFDPERIFNPGRLYDWL